MAHLNSTDVLLGWRFGDAYSEGCLIPPLTDVTFHLHYESRAGVRTGNVEEHEADRRRVWLRRLSPGTLYSVKVRAVSGSAVSEDLSGNFRTLLGGEALWLDRFDT